MKHGMSDTHIYNLYHHIKDRCYNTNHHSYNNYGGRGIYMCEEWIGKNGFINFYNWAIKNGYKYGLTIDRIDSNGCYCPDNCRWITRGENTSKANSERRVQHRYANKGAYWGESPEGISFIFYNTNQFAAQHFLHPSVIRNIANGKNKSGHTKDGWSFGFVSDLLE